MGVRGLKSYLERNAEGGGCKRGHHLRDCHLVVDAANFVHYFYNDSSRLAYEYGGEYDLYADRLRRLFAKFRRCRIRPVFVFDGAKDWEGGKLRLQLKRMEDRVAKSAQLLSGGGRSDPRNRVLPVLTYEVFQDCLQEFDFPVATVLTGDADEQTATLAGRLGCPLMTVDSDFFLYPLSGGVVPTDKLDLSDAALDSTECHMTCSLYRLEDCRLRTEGGGGGNGVRLRAELAPLWAGLIGNDYVAEEEAAEARRRLGVRAGGGRGDAVTTETIRWAHEFETAEACLAEMRRKLDGDLVRRFEDSVRHYQFKPDSEALALRQDGTAIAWPGPPPPPITNAHRTRQKLVFFIDSLLYRQVILPIGLEHPDMPGAFESTRGLRSVAYWLEASRGGADDKAAVVSEHVRHGIRVRTVPVSVDASHRCPKAVAAGKEDEAAGDDSLWCCALATLGASDEALSARLPEPLTTDTCGGRRLRLALHLLRAQRRATAREVAELGDNCDDRRRRVLTDAGACVAKALLALCLVLNCQRDDDADKGPARKRARLSVDFDAYLAPRSRDSATASADQRSPSYLAVLHHFNAFQAHLVSLTMFLQAHVEGPLSPMLPPLPRLLVGRFVYGLASDLLARHLDWDGCLAELADRLGGDGVTADSLKRLSDWVVGGCAE